MTVAKKCISANLKLHRFKTKSSVPTSRISISLSNHGNRGDWRFIYLTADYPITKVSHIKFDDDDCITNVEVGASHCATIVDEGYQRLQNDTRTTLSNMNTAFSNFTLKEKPESKKN